VFAVVLVLIAPLINLGNLFHLAEVWDSELVLPALTVQAVDGEDWDMDLRVGGLASPNLRITWREGETTYTAVCWQARWEPLAEAIRHLQMAETEGTWKTEAGMDHLSEGQTRAALLLRGNTVAYAEAVGPAADDATVTDYVLQMADYGERQEEP
jgi:hypothetical protein